MKKPLLLVLTGASSVGKKPLSEALLKDLDLDLHYAISLTTRPKKEHEEDGKHYFFVDHPRFAQFIKERRLLEFTEFGGYFYGTILEQVTLLLDIGKNVLIDVEAQGVGQIKLAFPKALCIFVEPEDMNELETQIWERYEDERTNAQQRINKAKVEMELLPLFKHRVKVNDIDKAVADIKDIIEEAK